MKQPVTRSTASLTWERDQLNNQLAQRGGGLRIGTEERDKVIDLLQARFVSGHLNEDELEQRTALALRARTEADLAAIRNDLPEVPTVTVSPSLSLAWRWVIACVAVALMIGVGGVIKAGYHSQGSSNTYSQQQSPSYTTVMPGQLNGVWCNKNHLNYTMFLSHNGTPDDANAICASGFYHGKRSPVWQIQAPLWP